jgi:PKD repeat protein
MINENTLIIEFLENQNGNAEISILGSASGQSISDTFAITVNPVDDPPIVANEISDITADEDDSNETIDLTNVFSDIDDTEITKSIASNSNPTLISAMINENTLIIEFLENQSGNAEISILGSAGGKSISDVFLVTVNAVNDEPSISAISDQRVEDTSVTVSFTINDVETASEDLSLSLQSSAPDILPVLPENFFMSGTGSSRAMTLTPVEGAYGACMLTLVVSDSSTSSSTSFTFENIQPTYTIVTIADGNGSISPSGTITILKGNNKTLSIVPSNGHRIDDVLINGDAVGSQTQYTFWSVAQNYTIQAIFSPIPAPVADFYAEPISGDVPLVVNFVNTSQNDFSSAQWTFGDNSKSTIISPSHTYAIPGQYTVCLSVTGAGGTHALTKTAYIQVNESCNLNIQFSANNRTVPIQTDIQMTAIVSDNSASLIWDFGDGSSSNERNPTHAYSTPGLYDVRLTAIGAAQDCTVTTIKTDYIQVVGRSIHGQIRAGGNGVDDCLVSLWINEMRMLDFAVSDENGDYTFDNLPARPGLVMSVFPPSSMRDQYETQYYPDAVLFSEAERISTQNQDLQIDIDLIEPPDNGISGQIRINAQGIADALVNVFSESLDHARTVITDEQGYYTITGLPLADDYIVDAFIDTFNQNYYYSIPKGETSGTYIPDSSVTRYMRATAVEPDDPILQHIDIIVQNAQISGTVLSDGEPVSNVQIYAWSNEIWCDNFSTTNANGQYTISGLMAVSDIDAPTKGYIVELQSDGYPYQVYHNQTDIELATRIETGRNDIDFQFNSFRQVCGRVSDTNNVPLSGAFVQIASNDVDTKADTYTDENGHYTFTNLPPASDYIVYAYVQGYPLKYYKNSDRLYEALPVNAFDNHAENIDIIMDKGPVIKGQVSFLENGQPVGEGIWVNISSEHSNSGGDVPTDSNGNYEITGLDSDTNDYIVSIWHSNYVNVFYSSSGSVYQYEDATPISPSDENRNLTLTPGYCISGTITYASAPIEDIQVWADGITSGSTLSLSETVNDANYEICGLVSGSYEVNILSDQYLNDSYPDPVIIETNNQSDINFQLTLPSRTLGGIIYQSDENEIIRLYASSNDCQEFLRIKGTGAPVAFTFTNLQPASDYRLEIRADNHDYQVYNNKTILTEGTLIDLSTENTDGIEITLTRSTAKINGFIQFPDPLLKDNSIWLSTSSGRLNLEIEPSVAGGNVPYTLTGTEISTHCEVRLVSDYYEQQLKIVNTQDTHPDNAVNFILIPGGTISGQIRNAANEGVSGINVMVWSENLIMGGTGQTDNNGNYQIGGLNAASDYDVSVQYNSTTFYYHLDGAVVQASKKGYIALTQGQAITEIDIQMFEGEKIEGTVRNTNGVPLANVYISVELGQDAAGSDTTNQEGRYRIDNLESALNYTVEAIPNSSSGYIKKVKNNIQSNSQQVDFVLQQGYSLSGKVMRWDQLPVENAEVEISSISTDTFPMPVFSDSQGNYEIKGLAFASDYFIQVIPPNDSNLGMFKNENMLIDDHTSLQVTLSSALCVSGTIKVSDAGEFLEFTQTARINMYSNDGFNEWTESQDGGTFELCHVPDTSDYSITVYSDGYVNQSLYNVFAGETVEVVLSTAKQILGYVKNSRGQAISGARVEIFSDMVQIPSKVTQEDGSFIFDGVPEYFNGVLIDDYSLLVTATGYPDTRKSDVALDTTINVVLETDDTLFISGTVTDINSNPLPEGYSVNVRLYEKNRNSDSVHMKIKQSINPDGTFIFTGLDANKTYKLKFKQFDHVGSVKMQEWAGENNIGVDKTKDSIFYSTGETVNFKFSEVWH